MAYEIDVNNEADMIASAGISDAGTGTGTASTGTAKQPTDSKTDVGATKTGGAGDDKGTSSLTGDNAGNSQSSSDGQQPDAQGKTSNADGGKGTVKLTDDLQKEAREALGLQDTTPNTVDYWRGRHSESSKEAKEFKRQNGLLNKRLEEMGLKVVMTDKAAELVATEKWKPSGDTPDVEKIVKGLTDAEKDLAIDDPDKYAALLVDKAIKATARPVPSKEKNEIVIDDTEKSAVREQIAAEKDKKGEHTFPDFDFMETWIDSMANDPSTPEDFIKFMNSSSENHKFALGLLHNRAAYRLLPILAKQKDASEQRNGKKKSATEDVSLTSEGTTTTQSRQAESSDDEAERIATAGQTW